MTNKNNAKCTICGKEYERCNSCEDQKRLKPWKIVTDTIEHYKIYLAIHGYTVSKDKETAKKELENCNLDGLENFNPEIKAVIKEIMNEPKKKFVSKKEKNVLNDKATLSKEDVNETKDIIE